MTPSNRRLSIILVVGCFVAACSNAPGSVGPARSAGAGVAAVAAGGLVISSPLILDKTDLVLGDTLNATVTYTNTSASSITLQHVVIAGRPPGGTDAGGPYADLTPSMGPQDRPRLSATALLVIWPR